MTWDVVLDSKAKDQLQDFDKNIRENSKEDKKA